MNRDAIIALLEDGAYFDSRDSKIYHPSFRKGWRKLKTTDISWAAVERMHGAHTAANRLTCDDSRVYRLNPVIE